MSFLRRSFLVLAALFALVSLPAAAQSGSEMDSDHPWWGHGVAFWSQRDPDGCLICEPSIDLNGGYFMTKDAADGNQDWGFFRLHTQMGLAVRHVSLAMNLLWLPGATGGTPRFSVLGQYEPFSQLSRVYLSGGVGLINESPFTSNGTTRMQGWVQATLAYRSMIHDITPFVEAGTILAGNNRKPELLFGIAHPIAPYKMHWTLDK